MKVVLEFLPAELRHISSSICDDDTYAKLDIITGTDIASLLTRSTVDSTSSSDRDINSHDLIHSPVLQLIILYVPC